MDREKITAALDLPADSPLRLTGLALALWGRDMIFEGLAGEETRFRLLLSDCREVRWTLYAHMAPDEHSAFPPAAIISLSLGRDQHRVALQLLTDYFGLSVSYGQLHIERQ